MSDRVANVIVERILKRILNEAQNKMPLSYDVSFSKKLVMDKASGEKKVSKTVWLIFENLNNVDANSLREKFRAKGKGGEAMYPITAAVAENFVKGTVLPKVYEYLNGTGRYDMPPLQQIQEDIISAVGDDITTEDMIAADKANDNIWNEFIKNIKNPDTWKLIQSFSQLQNDKKYGWVMSIYNAILARAQFPSATFLKTRKQWKNDFNRRITPGADKILLVLGGGDLDWSRLPQALKDLGHKSNVNFKDLGPQEQHALKTYIKSLGSTGQKRRQYQVFYDVSQTEPYHGSEDKWNTTIGVKNNLTGELNDYALNDKVKNQEQNSDIKQMYSEQGNAEKVYTALKNFVVKNTQDFPNMQGIIGSDGGDYEVKAATLIKHVADKLLEKTAKILRPENRSRGVTITTVIVLALSRIYPEKVAHELKNNDIEEKEYIDIRNVINKIIREINNDGGEMVESIKNIKESFVPYLQSVDELLGMMGMSHEDFSQNQNDQENITDEVDVEQQIVNNEISSITETFNNTLKRINNVIL